MDFVREMAIRMAAHYTPEQLVEQLELAIEKWKVSNKSDKELIVLSFNCSLIMHKAVLTKASAEDSIKSMEEVDRAVKLFNDIKIN